MTEFINPYGIWTREKFQVNTDPQRRCYNGCHFSSEWRWSEWKLLYHVPQAEVEICLDGWKRIGRKTSEFKAFPKGADPNVEVEEHLEIVERVA